MKYKVISFYKYTRIEDPSVLKGVLMEHCKALSLLGRILLGKEGVNGAVSGEEESIEQFKQRLRENPSLVDLTFREQSCDKNAYHKLVVRIRQEIVAFGQEIDPQKKGRYLAPKELKEWYDRQADFLIIDVRNEYEYDLGRFKSALGLPIGTFSEFPRIVKDLKPFKEKKIVLYCTGGIRCEKASAYLKESGFDDVYQLEGGIINYVNQFPNTYWKGSCFVFDDRLVSEEDGPITECKFCARNCGKYTNCHNLDCDRLFIACAACLKIRNNTCSDGCKTAPRQRKESIMQSKQKIIGVVKNYYPRAKVALVKVKGGRLQKNCPLLFIGKTTLTFTQEITELRDENGKNIDYGERNQGVSFPVTQKVRKNDKVVLACS